MSNVSVPGQLNNKQVAPILSELEENTQMIANLYAEGKSIKKIAKKLGVDKSVIVATISDPRVERYTNTILRSKKYTSRVKRQALLSKMAQVAYDKGDLKEARETLKLLNKEDNDMKQQDKPGTAVQINNYAPNTDELYRRMGLGDQ